MKRSVILSILCIVTGCLCAQTVVINQTPCPGIDVQLLPALYYDHTRPKYGRFTGMDKFAPAEKIKVLNLLDQLEKLEAGSRQNFKATGCVMRVSYSGSGKVSFGGHMHAGYGYQLGLYQMVCHQQQQVVKETGEYRSVLRIEANSALTEGNYYSERGDFYITDKKVRYEIPIDAMQTAAYDKDRIDRRSRIACFISADMFLQNKSNSKGDFEKLNLGEGYTDMEVQTGIMRRTWLITKKEIPLLVPVTRRQYLEALLEYYEIEKYNIEKAKSGKQGEISRSGSDDATNKRAVYDADKAAYLLIYKSKKERISRILSGQPAAWLDSPMYAAGRNARENDYNQPSNGLFDIKEFDTGVPLYQYNPVYFKADVRDTVKPVFFKIEFRYEKGADRQWSQNLLNNFMQHFDFTSLRKMIN